MEGDFVEDPPDDLVCPVCLLPCKDPHLISCCGRKLCLACITGIQDSGLAEVACPCCRSIEYETMRDKLVERRVLDLKVYCKYKEKGCTWTGELRDMELHTEDCLHRVVSCIYNCGLYCPQLGMYIHERDTCDNRPEILLQNEIKTLKERVSALEKKCKEKDAENESQRQLINQYKRTISDNEVHTQIILRANDEVNQKFISCTESKEELQSLTEHLEAKLHSCKKKHKVLRNEMMSLLRTSDVNDSDNEEDDGLLEVNEKKERNDSYAAIEECSNVVSKSVQYKTPLPFELCDDVIFKKQPDEPVMEYFENERPASNDFTVLKEEEYYKKTEL